MEKLGFHQVDRNGANLSKTLNKFWRVLLWKKTRNLLFLLRNHPEITQKVKNKNRHEGMNWNKIK